MRVHTLRQYVRLPTHRSTQRRPRPVRDFRARGKLMLVAVKRDQCGLCEGTIDRFDNATFGIAGHCGPCHAELNSD